MSQLKSCWAKSDDFLFGKIASLPAIRRCDTNNRAASTPEKLRALADRVNYYRDLGIYEFYPPTILTQVLIRGSEEIDLVETHHRLS